MRIAFVGDVQGRIFHLFSVLDSWQSRNNCKFDAMIQVGDLGAYPNPDEKMLTSKFVLQDPTELDFSRFIYADKDLKNYLLLTREQFKCPIWFIRGNHEDFLWLDEIKRSSINPISSIDQFDLLHYVSDGTVTDIHNMKVAFLGGIETSELDEGSINEIEYQKLIQYSPGEIDVLVTHDAPYGINVGFKGKVQGSKKITHLIEQVQPKYLIAGHYHHMNGPRKYGRTIYMGLNILVPPIRKEELGKVQAGSICVLDTVTNMLEFVTDEWLSEFDCEFQFSKYVKGLKKID